MKNIWIPFFTLILIVSSCSKDFEDVTSNQEVSSISLRGKMDKVSICHYDEDTDTWKTLNVSGNSLKGHLKHGDVVGECSIFPTNGLVAWFPFNGNANDESGNGNDGTLVGTVPFITDREGNVNSAIQGGSGYIPTSNQFFRFSRTDSFTISVWFTVPENGCSGRLLSTESSEGHLRVAYAGSGQIVVQFGDYLYPSPVTTDQWHHLVYVYDNRNEMVYLDGQLDITNYEQEMSEVLVYNTPFTIGAKASSAYDKWCGNIDDLGVWNRPLTQQEVEDLYNSSKN